MHIFHNFTIIGSEFIDLFFICVGKVNPVKQNNKAPVQAAEESSEEDSDDSDEEEVPTTAAKGNCLKLTFSSIQTSKCK